MNTASRLWHNDETSELNEAISVNLKPRFIFHANCSALGGRISAPKDILIESAAASSLSAAGGRSTSKAGKGRCGDMVRFRSASTFAEGFFDDPQKWGATLCGDCSEDTLTASITVRAEVRDIEVAGKIGFSAKRVVGGFAAKSAGISGEPAIGLHGDTAIEGVKLGGFKLIVELNTKLFQSCDTMSKLRAGVDDPEFVRDNGANLFLDTAVSGRTTASPEGRFVESGGKIYGTVVRSIRWAKKPLPGAVIEGHTITVPDYGSIFFGEISLSAASRRLTMVRLDLCHPRPMRMMMSDSEDNGTWGV
jgi:hypothetical protein